MQTPCAYLVPGFGGRSHRLDLLLHSVLVIGGMLGKRAWSPMVTNVLRTLAPA